MSRDYVFTAWEEPDWCEKNCRYICWGVELCPKTKKMHWQGFAIFSRTCRFKMAKKWIGAGDKTHIEVRKGTRCDARKYCMKDGIFHEYGIFEGHTKECIFKLPLIRIKEEYPEFYCRYHRGLEKLNVDKGIPWRNICVHWLWGTAGCGKTKMAMKHMTETSGVFKLDRPFKWFDGYNGEETLVIDDVDRDDFDQYRGLFLNLLDGYRLRLEIKGSFTYAKWCHVFITSNFNPNGFLDCCKAFKRRVTTVTGLG